MTKKILSSVFIFPVLVFLISCRGSTPSEIVARDFMEAYYVRTDLVAASQLADSLAQEKVKSSESLRNGLIPDRNAHQPRVSWKLLESQQQDEGSATYLYRVDFKPDQAAAVHKKALLRIRQREGGSWKVTQFTDFDTGTE